MTTEEKAEFLKQYNYCKDRMLILLERKRAYQTNIYGIKSPVISDMPKASSHTYIDDKIIDCATLTAEIDEEIKLLNKKMIFIKNLIQSVPNMRYRSMLEMRFIDNLQNKQVMGIINRSFQATQTLRRKAIRSMNITKDTLKEYESIE